VSASKTLPSLHKLANVRLNLRNFEENLALVKQNVLNRNADTYASPDLVLGMYTQYKEQRRDLDQLRQRRN